MQDHWGIFMESSVAKRYLTAYKKEKLPEEIK